MLIIIMLIIIINSVLWLPGSGATQASCCRGMGCSVFFHVMVRQVGPQEGPQERHKKTKRIYSQVLEGRSLHIMQGHRARPGAVASDRYPHLSSL